MIVRPKLVLVAGSLLLLGFAWTLVTSVPTAAQPPASHLPGELLVGFRAGVGHADAEAVYRAHGATKLEEIAGTLVHRIRVAPAALDAVEKALAHRPEVSFVEKNRLVPPDAYPNDPRYPEQWHLKKISAEPAWDVSTGTADVVIAVLDTGVDCTHPDLAAKCVPGYNAYANTFDTADTAGHGTRVAGTAAAIGNDALGVASPAWKNAIMPIRIANDTSYASYSTIAKGLTWAVDHGATVMNISFGVRGSSTVSSAAAYVRNKGGLVVASGGNCGCLEAATDDPNIIFVAATDQYDQRASFSSQGQHIDVSAPGVSILSTTLGHTYASASGTSHASPLTAGVVALMKSANRALAPSQIEALLKSTADDLGTAGRDASFGYGRINASRAVTAAADSIAPSDMLPPTVAITSPTNGSTVVGAITVTATATDDHGVARVDLLVDGTLYASDSTSPYSFYWDTTRAVNGGHRLLARALDAAGNASSSIEVTVQVSNATATTSTTTVSTGADTTPPTASIRTIYVASNRLRVDVAASDDVGVTKVELLMDSRVIAADSSSPWSFAVRAKSLAAGAHSFAARAYDAAGHVTTSPAVTFSLP